MSRSGGLYGRFQFFTYAASAIEVATLACLLFVVAGEGLSRPRARAVRALSFVYMSSFDGVASRYRNEQDPERKARMAEAYEGLTGRDIDRHYN